MKSYTFILAALSSVAFAAVPTARITGAPITPQWQALNDIPPASVFDAGQVRIMRVVPLPTVTIPTAQGDLDVTLVEDYIQKTMPFVRHHPTQLPNRTAKYHAGQNLKALSAYIAPYADAPDASFEVLMLGAKLHYMAKNTGLGAHYGAKAGDYLARALVKRPDNLEGNLLFGILLSESGGFSEGRKYLERAQSLGSLEASQSLVQADLLSDNRQAALSRLQSLRAKHPDNPLLPQQIAIVEAGGYYIWDMAPVAP